MCIDSLYAQLQADKTESSRHATGQQLPDEMGYQTGDPTSTMGSQDMISGFADATNGSVLGGSRPMPSLTVTSSDNASGNLPWDLVGLGLEESLPPADMVEEL